MTNVDANAEQTPPQDSVKSRRVSKLVVFLAIVLTALGVFLSWAAASRKGMLPFGGEMTGYTLAPIIFGMIFVAIFQLFKRFRNQHSRWKTYCWVLFLSSLGSISNLFQELAAISAR